MTGVPGNATVLDAIVLSKFVRVDAVELLLELPRVVTLDEVATELERGRDAYLDHAIAILGEEITVVESAQSARKIVQGLLKTLDPGEQQAGRSPRRWTGLWSRTTGDALSGVVTEPLETAQIH
jgi:hypothetical protein